MRHDHRPLWLKRFADGIAARYVDHFIRPQFDGAGRDLRVLYPTSLQVSGTGISVGEHVHIMSLPDNPVRLASFLNMGEIHIGDFSIVNPGTRISSASGIHIGEACMLASNCYLSDADWHDIEHRIYGPGATAPIRLGNNVWIGDGALVCKGVEIGDNSVVGAHAVVTKSVSPNTIVAGNPAREIRQIDPSNLTTRRALFRGDEPYDAFEARYLAETMGRNTLLGYLASLLFPDRRH